VRKINDFGGIGTLTGQAIRQKPGEEGRLRRCAAELRGGPPLAKLVDKLSEIDGCSRATLVCGD
jgi:hypothetical protein